MKLEKFLLRDDPALNIRLYGAKNLDGEEAPVSTEFWDRERIVARKGGYFLDSEISQDDNLARELLRLNGNVSWVEQSVNGRHLIDYTTIEEEAEIPTVWFSLILRIEAVLSSTDWPRQYLMNIQKEFGLDMWFNFALLRGPKDAAPLPAQKYEVPTFRFIVGTT